MAGGDGFLASQTASQHVLAQKFVVGRADRVHSADDAAGGQGKSLNGIVVTQSRRHAVKFLNLAIGVHHQRAEGFYLENKA